MDYKVFYIEYSEKEGMKYNLVYHTILLAANEADAKRKHIQKEKVYSINNIIFLKVEEIGTMSTKQPIEDYGCCNIKF